MTHPQLDVLRKQLDELDEHLVSLLAERFKITDQIGLYKCEHHMAPSDPSRERTQEERIRKLAAKHGLDVKIAEKVLRVIINETVERHRAVQEQL
jgi:chorismate mutase